MPVRRWLAAHPVTVPVTLELSTSHVDGLSAGMIPDQYASRPGPRLPAVGTQVRILPSVHTRLPPVFKGLPDHSLNQEPLPVSDAQSQYLQTVTEDIIKMVKAELGLAPAFDKKKQQYTYTLGPPSATTTEQIWRLRNEFFTNHNNKAVELTAYFHFFVHYNDKERRLLTDKLYNEEKLEFNPYPKAEKGIDPEDSS